MVWRKCSRCETFCVEHYLNIFAALLEKFVKINRYQGGEWKKGFLINEIPHRVHQRVVTNFEAINLIGQTTKWKGIVAKLFQLDFECIPEN